MKATILVLAAVAVLAVCGARRLTTTMRPCVGRCSLEYQPVCAQDPSGAYYLFTNQCLFRACSCRTNVEFTQLDDRDDCPSDAKTKCPDQLADSLIEGYNDDDDSLEVPGAQSDSVDSFDAARREDPQSNVRWVPLQWLPSDALHYPY